MGSLGALALVLIFAIGSVARAQVSPPPAKQTPTRGTYPAVLIKGLKEEIAARDRKHLPNVIPAELVGPLDFRVPKCSSPVQVANIKSCKASTCWDEVPLMGLNSAVQNIVHGLNPQGNCAFSIHTTRYFIPRAKLSEFAELYRLGVFWNPNFQANIAAGQGMNKLVTSFRIVNQNCGIDLTYNKGKLISATLQRGASAICSEKNVTLPYQLEKQGLQLALPSAAH